MAKIKPGEIRNPYGRPKGSGLRTELIAAFKNRGMIEKAINILDKGMAGKDKEDCARYVLDQAFGKAPQAITGGDGGPISIRVDE